MSLPSLQMQPVSTSHYYTSGDVTIQAGVAIAPGVLLQADPNSRVVVKAGACIGIGAVLHAHDGVIEIGEGANIGAEVLLVGNVKVGANACIGAATTIFNSTIEWGQIVPPGSLLGETGRQPVDELQVTDTVVYPSAEPEPPHHDASTKRSAAGNTQDNGIQSGPDVASQPGNVNVYGQMYVNRMLVKLFPNRQPADNPSSTQDPALTVDDPWAD